jgi:Leucine-rich repeat (LRR) protein
LLCEYQKSDDSDQLKFFKFPFRSLVILLISLKSEAETIQFVCRYARYFFGEVFCHVENVDLTNQTIVDSFTFGGTLEEKERTNAIDFNRSGRVTHLPQNLVCEFPKLKILKIQHSEIPIVKGDFFGAQFSWIERLGLNSNGIKIIANKALEHLTDLWSIDLSENGIQSLNRNLFENNQKLMWIWLSDNKIKMISPDIFQNLSELRLVVLQRNECVDQLVGCWLCEPKINRTVLDSELQNCYDNYMDDM